MDEGTSNRATKRQRREYRRGSIIKVEVKNFMTYADCVIEPGQKLNLVLGPNGTGKSSLVCAICVGLAGATRLLGRAEDMSAFVRRGTEVGEVAITLASGDASRPYVIKRRINARDKSSEWWLNGQSCRQKDVTDVVQCLNIQLDNLCQFLPQDKVVEFARLKPVELLRATEQAVGDSALEQQHQQLIELRQELRQQTSAVQQISGEVARLKEENARSERSVLVIQKRDELLAQAEALRQKVPWAEYTAAKQEYEEENQRLKEAKQALQRMKAAKNANDAPLRAKKDSAAAAQNRAAKAQVAARRADPAVEDSQGRDRRQLVDELVESIEDKGKEAAGLEGEAVDRERRVREAGEAVERLKEQMAAVPTEADPEVQRLQKAAQAQHADITAQELAVAAQLEEAESEAEVARVASGRVAEQLRRLGDAKQLRLQVLDGRFRGIASAWQWLQTNRGRFRGSVLGPIAMEVEIQDPVHAAMLEQHVANNVWAYFVVEHEADQDLLIAELRTHCGGFRPMVTYYRADSNQALKHPCGRGTTHACFGVTGTLDECFQAPLLVKHVMNDNSMISSALVMARADADWEGLFAAERKAQVVWTPEAQIQRRTSHYNAAAVSTMVTPLRPPQLLSSAAGAGAGEDADRASLQARLQEREGEQRAAESRAAELRPQLDGFRERKKGAEGEMGRLRKVVMDAMQRRTRLNSQVKAKEKELARLQAQPDPRRRRPVLEKEIGQLRCKAFEAAKALASSFSSSSAALAAYAAADLSVRELADQVNRLKAAKEGSEREVKQLEGLVGTYKRGVDGLKAAASAKMAAAKAVTGWPLSDEMAEAFAEMPSSAKELQRLAQGKEDESEGLMISDPGALQRYRERCDKIATGEADLALAEGRRATAAADVERIKGLWLPELKRVVAAINATFEGSFREVGCAGEVALREAEGEDFANYAIEIRVKFRDSEPLATLDANRQSGGERSVSTILYLVALQGVAVAPFRVVDEINQGMDPVNERKVFSQLVEAATQPNTPQCFLLTPKLLPDLPFSREVTVLQIMNGAHIRPVAAGFTMERVLGEGRMAALLKVN